ncbi:MAG: permease [Candidatus Woesearchaeota archaeon]
MLQQIIDWFFSSVLRLNPESKTVEVLNYFLYDSIKIILMLFLMIAIVGFIRTYLPYKKVKSWISNKNKLFSHAAASLFGAITPFCSCSSIPIFFSFIRGGIPLGVSFSFLITSPLVNEYLVVLMLGFFGWKITLAYVLAGIIGGIFLGVILGRMNLDRHLLKDITSSDIPKLKSFSNLKSRINYGMKEAWSITKKLYLWILLGVAVGAVIHNYVPAELITRLINKGGIFSVPLATLVGVPLYGSCAAIVPIAVALFDKGVPLGTAIAFMMGMAALSFPEAILLRRIMNLKLILIFFGVVTAGIIIIGYLLNFLQVYLI